MKRTVIRRRRSYQIGVEAMEPRQLLTAMLGLTTTDALVSFDSSRPDVLSVPLPISGLQAGETVLAIDSRPTTGQLFGLGSTGRIYNIDPLTGATAQVGPGPIATTLTGTDFDIDFRSSSSVMRIVSDSGMDLRFDVDTATLTVDGTLAYATGDPGAGTTPSIVAAAYNNNGNGGGDASLYEIDAKRDMLVFQGNPFGTDHNGENQGQLFSYRPLGVNVVGPVGLEITPGGQPLLSMAAPDGSGSALYSLASGGQFTPATLIGLFPTSVTVRDITTLPQSPLVYAVTEANALISFRAGSPGDIQSMRAITGLQPGESIGSIAFQPGGGSLYGFGSTGRLYTFNPATSAASAVSATPIAPTYDGSKPSIAFLADTGRVRLMTKLGQDLQIDPSNGTVVAVDNPLAYNPNDPAAGMPPSIVAASAATVAVQITERSFVETDLFGIDSARDTFVELSGETTPDRIDTAAPLGQDVTDDAGLTSSPLGDPSSAVTLASLTTAGASASTLYRLVPALLGTRASLNSAKIGNIGGGSLVRSIAIAPSDTVAIDPPGQVSETAGQATITVRRNGGANGPLSVRAVTSDGTATAGVNYTPVNVELDFADGETIKTFSVPIHAGSFSDGTRTLTVSIAPLSGSVVSSQTLTIVGTATTAPGILQSVTFEGSAAKVGGLVVTFTAPVDIFAANATTEYTVVGVTADRSRRTLVLPVFATPVDPAGPGTSLTTTAQLFFATPIALKNFRSIQVTAKGIGPNGVDSTQTYTITRGVIVHYTDADGDRIVLGVLGRGANLVVVRRADGQNTTVFVEGKGRSVYGLLIPTRRSNRKTTIDRFVTGGAQLHLVKSITVNQVVSA